MQVLASEGIPALPSARPLLPHILNSCHVSTGRRQTEFVLVFLSMKFQIRSLCSAHARSASQGFLTRMQAWETEPLLRRDDQSHAPGDPSSGQRNSRVCRDPGLWLQGQREGRQQPHEPLHRHQLDPCLGFTHQFRQRADLQGASEFFRLLINCFTWV